MSQLLDDLAAFQRVLFTNHRVQALADAIREGTGSWPDPDPRVAGNSGGNGIGITRGDCDPQLHHVERFLAVRSTAHSPISGKRRSLALDVAEAAAPHVSRVG